MLINLIAGVFIFPDYGTSTDEGWEFNRSSLALKMYAGSLEGEPEYAYWNLESTHVGQFYGTAHSTILRLLNKLYHPGGRFFFDPFAHYYYFLYFQAAVAGIFLLARLFVSEWTSLGVAVIFGTQPLLFGHGFINPKDSPLMSVFLLTVVAGFYMVDRWTRAQTANSTVPISACLSGWLDWPHCYG